MKKRVMLRVEKKKKVMVKTLKQRLMKKRDRKTVEYNLRKSLKF